MRTWKALKTRILEHPLGIFHAFLNAFKDAHIQIRIFNTFNAHSRMRIHEMRIGCVSDAHLKMRIFVELQRCAFWLVG